MIKLEQAKWNYCEAIRRNDNYEAEGYLRIITDLECQAYATGAMWSPCEVDYAQMKRENYEN